MSRTHHHSTQGLLLPRFWLVVGWLFVSSPIINAASQLPLGGVEHFLAWGVVAPALAAIGIHRCMRTTLELLDDGILIRNIFRDTWLSLDDVRAVVLKRVGSRLPVTDELVSKLPLAATIYGVRFPAVAFLLRDGSTSPAAAVTAVVGPRSREALLQTIAEFIRPRGIALAIRRPNRGWLLGALWDVRLGRGVTSGSSCDD